MKILFSLILLWIGICSFAQQEPPLNRKVNRLENAYKDVVKLSDLDPVFRNKSLPEVISGKTALALHFPGTINSFLLRPEDRSVLEDWIRDYPLEHTQYVEFLEKTIRNAR